jgi:hypothetical protein
MLAVIVNLFVAICFLLFGIYEFYYEYAHGELDPKFRTFLGMNLGWLAVLFCAFNLVRAWSNWYRWSSSKQRREAYADEALRRQRDRHCREAGPPQPPDPNFQFTDEPRPNP